MILSGNRQFIANWLALNDEVLLANTVFSWQIESNFSKILLLTSKSSKTASITKSELLAVVSNEFCVSINPRILSVSKLACLAVLSMVFTDAANLSSETSFNITLNP